MPHAVQLASANLKGFTSRDLYLILYVYKAHIGKASASVNAEVTSW